jgi:ribosome modulation factor
MTQKQRDAPMAAREREYRDVVLGADPLDSLIRADTRGQRAGEGEYLASSCPYTADARRVAWFTGWLRGLAVRGIAPPSDVLPTLALMGLRVEGLL